MSDTQVDDPFVLDIQVITDLPAVEVGAGCSTDDGCGSTCPSACVSNA